MLISDQTTFDQESTTSVSGEDQRRAANTLTLCPIKVRRVSTGDWSGVGNTDLQTPTAARPCGVRRLAQQSTAARTEQVVERSKA
ncbi:hypothetical protein J6590_044716 [Homalodisca vitripennis]|nr:hypothetical protein J6590_044716 [Homalodisca vitripennis]